MSGHGVPSAPTNQRIDAAGMLHLFLHGGGWVIGSLDSHDRMCRRLATVAGICVVAVDYRLAPEHPFPAALDDAAAAWRWIHARAQQLHVAIGAIAVGGDSAGGNLAAVLALMGRDGTVPASCYQALFYPVLDLIADADSYRRMTSDLPLTAATMHYFIDHYTPRAHDRHDWRVSPLRAASLAGAPPTLLLTVSHDPLCDEGRAYAQRLDLEGVRVCALHLNDQMHGLLGQGDARGIHPQAGPAQRAAEAGQVVGQLAGSGVAEQHGHAPLRRPLPRVSAARWPARA